MATYRELQAQLVALTEQAEAARLAERDAILDQVREFVSIYELTEREIFGLRRTNAKRSLQPKYRDPKTGATWSGRGRAPAWLVGKNRDRFLIKD
ncbi:H-NS family nucleoid-associated regulatory protein [Burkholderia ubonensis]|uniref:H-NS histone family protein n=1 Tax=Burkholderia ubonensis TaxID=101571 RepID=UPI0009B3735D|nr:H-NS histone family protein [Burkholderia ubonensis]